MQAEKVARRYAHTKALSQSLRTIGLAHWKASEYDHALAALHEALPLFESLADHSGAAVALNTLGLIYSGIGDYEQALAFHQRNLSLRQQLADRTGEALSRNNIGLVYWNLGEYPKSLAFLEQSLTLYRQMQAPAGAAMSLVNIGVAYQNLGNAASAQMHYEESLVLYRKVKDRRGEAVALGNLGNLQSDLGNIEAAEAHYLNSLKLLAATGDKPDEAAALLSLGQLYLKSNRLRESEKTLSVALQLAERLRIKPLLFEVHRTLSDACKRLNAFETALAHHERFYQLKEEVLSEQMHHKIKAFEVERVQREKEIYQLKSEQLELTVTHQAEELSHRNRELTSTALNLVQKNEFLEEVKARLLETAKALDAPARNLLNTVLAEIDRRRRPEQTLKTFEHQFDQVHQNFMRSLADRFPALTPLELKICSMLKINLSSKEISNLLYVSAKSIDTYRYRIRKKLRLASDKNLTAFLTSL